MLDQTINFLVFYLGIHLNTESGMFHKVLRLCITRHKEDYIDYIYMYSFEIELILCTVCIKMIVVRKVIAYISVKR